MSITAFLERVGFWQRLGQTMLSFGLPIAVAAAMPVVVTILFEMNRIEYTWTCYVLLGGLFMFLLGRYTIGYTFTLKTVHRDRLQPRAAGVAERERLDHAATQSATLDLQSVIQRHDRAMAWILEQVVNGRLSKAEVSPIVEILRQGPAAADDRENVQLLAEVRDFLDHLRKTDTLKADAHDASEPRS